MEKYYTQEPSYDGLIYDKYRSVIYRIVKHEQPYKNSDDMKNLMNESSWSILILDKDLKVLGEAIFDEKLYDFMNVFVNKEGLIVKHLDEKDGVIKASIFSTTF